jgi:hypothetical protein
MKKMIIAAVAALGMSLFASKAMANTTHMLCHADSHLMTINVYWSAESGSFQNVDIAVWKDGAQVNIPVAGRPMNFWADCGGRESLDQF